MRPWRPKKRDERADRPAAKSSGDFLALDPQAVRPARTPPRRMRIYMVQLAALPVVAGVAALAGVSVLTYAPRTFNLEGGPAGPRAGRSGGDVDVEFVAPGPGDASAPDLTAAELGGILADPARDWEERRAAAVRLGRDGSQEALQALLAASLESDDDARRLSATGLAQHLSDPRIEDALYRLIDDPVPTVAAAVARELGRRPEGRPYLVHRVRGRDAAGIVHLACFEGLADVGTPEDLDLLRAWAEEGGDVGMTAQWSVRSICERAGVPVPSWAAEPELPGRPRH